jgi:hypothetical protein
MNHAARRHFLRQYETLAASRLFTQVHAAAVLRHAASTSPLQGLAEAALPFAACPGAETTTTTGDAGCTMITSGLGFAAVGMGAGVALRTATFTGLTLVGGAAFAGSATGIATVATGKAIAGRAATGATGAINAVGSGAGIATTVCTGNAAGGCGAEPAHPVNPSTATRTKLRIPNAPKEPRGHLSAVALLGTN